MKSNRISLFNFVKIFVISILISSLFSCDNGFISSINEDTRSKYPSIEIWQGTDKLDPDGICAVDDAQELTDADFGFQIKNTGEADLELTNPSRIVIDDPDNAFSLVPPLPGTPIIAGGSESFTVRFSPPGTNTYSATVTVENNVTDKSSYSFTISGTGTATPVMGVPQNIDATDGSSTSEISVTWDPVDDASYYYIYRSTSDSIPASEEYTSFSNSKTDTSCTSGVKYFYWVKAGNSELGLGDPGIRDSGYMKLSSPEVDSASDESTTAVNVQWSHAATGGATSYEIYRSESDSPPSESTAATFTGISGLATSYNDISAEVGILYYYWVRAAASSSNSKSNWSNSSVDGYRMISVPVHYSISTSTLWEIILYFYPVDGAESYTFYASLTPSGTYQEASTNSVEDMGNGTWKAIFTGFQWNDGSNSYWECFVDHYFKIRAYNSVTGYSDYSEPSEGGQAAQNG